MYETHTDAKNKAFENGIQWETDKVQAAQAELNATIDPMWQKSSSVSSGHYIANGGSAKGRVGDGELPDRQHLTWGRSLFAVQALLEGICEILGEFGGAANSSDQAGTSLQRSTRLRRIGER